MSAGTRSEWQRVGAYRPQFHGFLTAVQWNAVADDLTRRSVEASRSEDTALSLLSHAASLTSWAVKRNLPLSAEVMLLPRNRERFVADAAEESQATLRWALAQLADPSRSRPEPEPVSPRRSAGAEPEAADVDSCGLAHCPEYWAVLASVQHHLSGVADLPSSAGKLPYSGIEVVNFYAAASSLMPITRIAVRTFLALGLGAGIVGADALNAAPADVLCSSSGIHVRIRGQRSRDVAVLTPFGPDLAARSNSEDHSGQLVPARRNSKRTPNRWNELATAVARQDPKAVRLEGARLRATWLSVILAHNPPLRTVLSAAGLARAERLDDFLSVTPDLASGICDLSQPWRQP